MAGRAKRLLDWWTDPAPGRMSRWLLRKAPDVMFLGGAVLFGAFGIALLVSNPAGNSTRGDAYGPDAPLQGWVIVVGGLFLFVAVSCLVAAGYGLWVRLTHGFEPWGDGEAASEDDASTEVSGLDEPNQSESDNSVP